MFESIEIPLYSSDANAALLVVEKLSSEVHCFKAKMEYINKKWGVTLTWTEYAKGLRIVESTEDTLAHAICVAALKFREMVPFKELIHAK